MQVSDVTTIGLIILLVIVIGYAVVGDTNYITERTTEEGEHVTMTDMFEPLPNLGKAGRLVGISDWINTGPIANEDLRGKVVMVDFWTYSCVNCIRTLPFLQGWHEKYKDNGFLLLGVHAPEFEFEKDLANVQTAVDKYGLTYPVGIDNDHRTWNSFKNRFWPAHYLIDVDGNLRFVHFGEGKYAETDAAIDSLLVEAGLRSADGELPDAEAETAQEPPEPRTAETYLGYLRLNNFGDPAADIVPDEPYTFSSPEELTPDRFYLNGEWSIHPEFAQTVSDTGGELIFSYQGKELNLVMDAPTGPIEVEVLLDGKPLTPKAAGGDITRRGGKSFVTVEQSRLYGLVDQSESDRHTLELRIPAAQVRLFAFTFG